VFSAEGANLNGSLGQRPRIRAMPKPSALEARFIPTALHSSIKPEPTDECA